MADADYKAFFEVLKYVGNYLMKSCDKPTDSIVVDRGISDEVLLKLRQSIKEYSRYKDKTYELSPVKIAAILCFWIKKLKPYSIEDKTGVSVFRLKVNEGCAVMAAKIYLRWQNGGRLEYNTEHLQSFLANLRYESTSIPSIIALFQAKTGNI